MTQSAPPLLTPRFMLVVFCGLSYFIGLTMLTPVIPLYVRNDLGHGDAAVGVSVGVLALGAVVLRLVAGRIGDTMGRRLLIIGGAALVAGSTLAYGAVHALWWLIAMRIVTGFGEAGFFVGAATMITDLAPVERRGEAVSYWSVAVYGGIAFGPALGDLVLGDDRYSTAFVVAAAFAGFAAIVGLFTRDVPREHPPEPQRRLYHPAALRPGTILFLGLMPLSAFMPLLPLYVRDDVDASAGIVFAVYGVLILTVRVVGARIPDRLGARNAGLLALSFGGAGILVITAWATPAGLYAGTAVFAVGMSLLYPAMLLYALTGIRDSERAQVVGTFSSFFDMATAIGGAAAGLVAEFAGYRGAFGVSGLLCLSGLLLLRRGAAPRPRAA